MKRRVKDLAFGIKIHKNVLHELASCLDADESKFYNNWDEPKTDSYGNPRFKDGKPLTRPINAPVKQLKHVQSQILKQVLYEFPLPEYFFGGIKNKDAALNARYHQGNKFFFLTDLKDFYPSVHSQTVEQTLRKLGFYPDVARIITRICQRFRF